MIEEVEIRTNIKHLTMSQPKACKRFQTDSGTLSKAKFFKSEEKERKATKHALLELSRKNNNILDDECPESEQDLGGHDLIDLIDSPHSRRDDGWTENCESPLRGLNGYSSPVMSNLVLLSDSNESSTARSHTISELVLDSESEDDGQALILSMSQSSDLRLSPELSTTPLSLIPSLSNSQNSTSAMNSGDVEDGNVSDDSHCSITSGPSRPPQPVAQGPCTHCLRLYMRMRRQPQRTRSLVKDPACLYYDQWWLLKPWRPQGVHGPRRVRGKLFEHLPLMWQRAKVQTERDLADECEVCTRPHVFLQRNLRQCKRPRPKSLNQTQARKKARSRQGRRSVNHWPPLGGGRRARRRKSKSTEGGRPRTGRPQREETDRGHKLSAEEHPTFDLTEDCSTEEHASLSPGRLQDMNTDIESSGFSDEHGGANTLSYSDTQADAKVGSQSHANTDGREDSLVDLRTDSPRDGYIDGHRERRGLSLNSVLTSGGHSMLKHVVIGADREVGRTADRQPVIRLFRCNGVNGNVGTDKQAAWLRQVPHKPTEVKHKGKHSCPQAADTGSDVDADLNRKDDQVTCFISAEGQTESLPVDAVIRHSDAGPNAHLNSPSGGTGGEVLDGAGRPVDGCKGGDSDLNAGVEQACRALSFGDVLKRPPPTTPVLAFSATPGMGSGQMWGGSAVPPRKDPYVFRTPTPPGTQCSGVLRKLRPFARTYESRGAESDGFKSMLCSMDRTDRKSVV